MTFVFADIAVIMFKFFRKETPPTVPVGHAMATAEYISRFDFDHLETVSINSERDMNERKKLVDRLSRKEDLTPQEQQYLNELLSYSREIELLLEKKGQFNRSNTRIARFDKGAPEIYQIKAILKTDASNVPHWMCWPVYRDAIFFYDASGAVVSTLHICFSCEYMAINGSQNLDADAAVYKELRKLFLSFGHPMERESLEK